MTFRQDNTILSQFKQIIAFVCVPSEPNVVVLINRIEGHERLIMYNVKSGEIINEANWDRYSEAIMISPNGKYLLASTRIFNLVTFEMLDDVFVNRDNILSAGISNDTVYILHERGELHSYNFLKRISHDYSSSRERNYYINVSTSGNLIITDRRYVYRSIDDNLVLIYTFQVQQDHVLASYDDSLFIGVFDGQFSFYDINDNFSKVKSFRYQEDYISTIVMGRTTNLLYITPADNPDNIDCFDFENEKNVQKIKISNDEDVLYLIPQISEDENYLYSVQGESLWEVTGVEAFIKDVDVEELFGDIKNAGS